MKFHYEPELLEFMKKKGQTTILVELVEVNSDIDVTELHVRLADDKLKDLFLSKKGYRRFTSDVGDVLLPPYPLTMEETVTFGLKSFLFIKYVTYKGMKV